MTSSQRYASEMSREKKVPIVLFDVAEVALFMADLTLFPVVLGYYVKGWEMVRSIALSTFSLEAAEAEVLSLVTDPAIDYGFAIVSRDQGELTLGVFEKVQIAAPRVPVSAN